VLSTDLLPFLGIAWERMSCWRLVTHVYAEQFGIRLPLYDTADQEDRVLVASLIENGRSNWVNVPRDGFCKFGDVLLFREDRLQPTHIAMAVNDAQMLHVTKGGFSRVDRWDDSFRGRIWRPRLCGVWRHELLV
jgi:cell wall-associated NlpC family hydrolase